MEPTVFETGANFTGIHQPTQSGTWQELSGSPGTTLTWSQRAPDAFLWHSKIIISFFLQGRLQGSMRKK